MGSARQQQVIERLKHLTGAESFDTKHAEALMQAMEGEGMRLTMEYIQQGVTNISASARFFSCGNVRIGRHEG